MHATYQLKPDELNEKFLQAIKKQFQNQTVEIAVSDIPTTEANNNEPQGGRAQRPHQDER